MRRYERGVKRIEDIGKQADIKKNTERMGREIKRNERVGRKKRPRELKFANKIRRKSNQINKSNIINVTLNPHQLLLQSLQLYRFNSASSICIKCDLRYKLHLRCVTIVYVLYLRQHSNVVFYESKS